MFSKYKIGIGDFFSREDLRMALWGVVGVFKAILIIICLPIILPYIFLMIMGHEMFPEKFIRLDRSKPPRGGSGVPRR